METQLELDTKKRGGTKLTPLHLGMLLLSTLLLTAAGVLIIYGLNWLGVLLMIAGIAVRVLDTKL